MARALESDSRFQTSLHHEQGVGIGAVALRSTGAASHIVWNEDESVALAMCGELYDTPALERSAGNGQGRPPAATQAGLALRLYERFGDEFASSLNGAFAISIWDRRERKLLVVTDRLRLFPVYYARVDGDLLFGSGVRALLADPALNRTVDPVAINEFLVYDHMLDDRTMLSAVRLVPQGSILTFQDGRLSVRQYWSPRYPEVYEPQPEAAYLEQFIHTFRQAVKRQEPAGRRAAMLLSGGLDSRLLLGALAEGGGSVETITFGIPGCDDAKVAAEVAAELRMRHRFIELKPDWLLGLAEEAVRVTDGHGNVVNLHALAPFASIAQAPDVVYKGFMGDAIFGFALKRQMWADYAPEARYRVHQGVHTEQGVVNYDAAGQERLLTDSFRARVGSGVCRSYAEGMERSGASQLANQRLFFDLTQRVPRMTLNGVEVARSHSTVRLPFCDNDLIDFAITVPPGFLFERYLPKAALIEYYPRLAHIPMAGTGRPMSACLRDLIAQARNLASWHLRRRGLGWLAGPERRPYKDYDNWFRTLLKPWVEDILLHPRALERGYFKPEYVRQLVDEHAGGAHHAVRIGALLTVELWHRQFLD